MQTALSTPPSPEHRESSPTFGDMLWEIADLVGGAVITLLPLLLLAVPSVILFLVLPALVLLAVAAVPVVAAGAILAPTYLLTRSVLRAVGTRRKAHRRGSERWQARPPAAEAPDRQCGPVERLDGLITTFTREPSGIRGRGQVGGGHPAPRRQQEARRSGR